MSDRRSYGAPLACLAVLLLAGCGGKGGGTTIVVNAPAMTPTTQLHAYRVPSGSMSPTVNLGESVFLATTVNQAKVGEIVVFHPPKDAEQEVCGPVPHVIKLGGAACAEPEPEPYTALFIKRIVGGPGDMISIVEGHVIRNGKRESDAYTKPCGSSPECNFPTPIKIPAGMWFTLGDNRGESDDSRFWGPVPTSRIVGVVRSCSQVGTPCAGP